MDREEYLHRAIETGKITDRDINDIMDHGDQKIRNKLERRANELYRKQKDLDRSYGKGVFTGIDNEGRPYKDLDSDEMRDALLKNL